jgi:hypothetical protein
MEEYQIVALESSLLDEVADLYSRVFAGPPWYEIKKCSVCGEPYGEGDDLRIFHNGLACRHCGKPLNLIDFWYGGPAHQVLEDALSQKGFIGIGARHVSGELIAFSWGYAVPEENTPTVWFKEINGLLKEQHLDPKLTFYAAETGVDPRFQEKGIGTSVMYPRLRAARAQFRGVCFRTINPKLVERYQHFFGRLNVNEMFHDPDPVKSKDVWYYCALENLKILAS